MAREIAMYAHFYQLSENPFNLTPDPKFHYVNTSTREAMASILHGIKSRKGFITLIAEAGTGKTTLLKRIVDEIEGETQVVFVFNPGVSFDELLEFICSELGIETHGCKRLHLLDRLNSHLLEQLTRSRNVVVMIDEAQTLEDSVLEELRLLSNLETAKEKILQILLSGQPELEEKLRKPALRQLRQRIGVRATLKPVRLEEMQAYVETRLKSAGAERNDLFTPAALKKIWQASNGIPRVINVVCDNAMMLAFADGKKRITPKLLREAVRDLEGEVAPGAFTGGAPEWLSSRATGYALAAAAVIAAAIPLAGVVGRALEAPSAVVASSKPSEQPTAATSGRAANRVAAETAKAAPAAVAGPRASSGASAAGEPGETTATSAEAEELRALRALEADARGRPAIVDSMRRAEVIARSTAARLYGTDRDGASGAQRRDITDAAMDAVNRDGGLKAPDLEAPAVGVDAIDDDALPAAIVTAEPPPADAAAARREVARSPIEPVPPVAAEPVGVAVASAKPEVEPIPEPAAPANVEPKPETKQAAKPEAKPETKQAAKPEAKRATKPEAKPEPKPAATAQSEVNAAVARAAAPEPKAEQGAATEAVSTTPAALPPGPFALGRAVRVKDGDTVWDIAIQHYGSAGSAVLKRILVSNPGVRDPLRLEVGSTVFLPFSRPEQMVRRESSGYRVVLASGTSRERVEAIARWASNASADVRMTSSTSGAGPALYEVSIVGLPSEAAALSLATNLFESSAGAPPERTAMR